MFLNARGWVPDKHLLTCKIYCFPTFFEYIYIYINCSTFRIDGKLKRVKWVRFVVFGEVESFLLHVQLSTSYHQILVIAGVNK